ncbi:LIM domain transcription factor LMO4-B [Holothuria leucospilota]|uniref:LIM domain transcription factor LMO4-B n=1 Tax=Holothuria leucospilota TaxID=206669 RepID=A0A9Q1H8B1_HOLLE|nr:LIM domain transcription factor LMO4-B [Holothuria leucospilota]
MRMTGSVEDQSSINNVLMDTTDSRANIENNNLPPKSTMTSSTDSSEVRSCAGCGGKINDRFLLNAVDRYWHTGCLKCSCCSVQLTEVGHSCFSKSGMILCRKDYLRLFGPSGACAACSQPIPSSELVMRVQSRVYHVKCFTCSSCHTRLVPGDRYSLVNGSILCELDHTRLSKSLVGNGPASQGIRTGHRVC